MSIYDSIGSYLFWAPWIGLIALISPLLFIAWGWRIFPTLRWLWVLLPLCVSTLLILASPLFIYLLVVFDLLALSVVVLDLLTDYGVDDVEIIIATSVHRRMKDWEVRHIVGDKIFNAYWPKKLYNHDADDPQGMKYVGETELGEKVILNKQAVESDLIGYALTGADGGVVAVTDEAQPIRDHDGSLHRMAGIVRIDPQSLRTAS